MHDCSKRSNFISAPEPLVQIASFHLWKRLDQQEVHVDFATSKEIQRLPPNLKGC